MTIDNAARRPDPQISTYNMCVHKHGHEAAWLAFIDVDEFLFAAPPSPGFPPPSLPVALEAYKDYAAVVVPWYLFGSSNHTESPSGLVIENYTWR